MINNNFLNNLITPYEHNCKGDHCPVCSEMPWCSNINKFSDYINEQMMI